MPQPSQPGTGGKAVTQARRSAMPPAVPASPAAVAARPAPSSAAARPAPSSAAHSDPPIYAPGPSQPWDAWHGKHGTLGGECSPSAVHCMSSLNLNLCSIGAGIMLLRPRSHHSTVVVDHLASYNFASMAGNTCISVNSYCLVLMFGLCSLCAGWQHGSRAAVGRVVRWHTDA